MQILRLFTQSTKINNKEMEQIARGKGFYLNPYHGKGVKDFLKDAIDLAEDIEEDVKSHLKTIIMPYKNGINIEAKDDLTFSVKK